MAHLDDFRSETRVWLEANYPPSLHELQASEDDVTWGGKRAVYKNPDSKLWLDRMAARGWTAPTWPKEYGGGGLTQEEARVLNQELGRIQARVSVRKSSSWAMRTLS